MPKNCPTLSPTEDHAQRLAAAVAYADDQLQQCSHVIECETDSDYEDGRSVNRTVLTFTWESGRDAKGDLREVISEMAEYLAPRR